MISSLYDISALKDLVKDELVKQQVILSWKLMARNMYYNDTLEKVYELKEGLDALDRALITTHQQQELASYLHELI